jgi:hypothetical protein
MAALRPPLVGIKAVGVSMRRRAAAWGAKWICAVSRWMPPHGFALPKENGPGACLFRMPCPSLGWSARRARQARRRRRRRTLCSRKAGVRAPPRGRAHPACRARPTWPSPRTEVVPARPAPWAVRGRRRGLGNEPAAPRTAFSRSARRGRR